jgi:hypothetical protein
MKMEQQDGTVQRPRIFENLDTNMTFKVILDKLHLPIFFVS